MAHEHPMLQVPEADVEDLRSRLRRTRWSQPWPGQGAGAEWRAGTDARELRRLV